MEPLDPRQLKLLIPKIWNRDWAEAIEEAEGTDEFLLSVQARAAYLLKPITDYEFTFERLAWFSIWTRLFSILDGVRAAILRDSTFFLEILARVEFELLLHTHTILQSDPVDRLRAYSAWCIWNDRSFQREVVNPKTLDGVWNVEPVQQLIENPSDLEIHERLFGPLPEGMDIDEREARRRRFRQQDRERHKLKRIEAWLRDPDLGVWVERIEELRKARRSTSFFALFDEDESSIAKRLTSMNMRFAYMGYMKGSMFVHGSTMEELFFINEESIAPRIVASTESVSDLANEIGSGCNNSLVVLGALRSRLWSIDESSNSQKPET